LGPRDLNAQESDYHTNDLRSAARRRPCQTAWNLGGRTLL
jgi:hypothetical protein